jgi:hypothetical protein
MRSNATAQVWEKYLTLTIALFRLEHPQYIEIYHWKCRLLKKRLIFPRRAGKIDNPAFENIVLLEWSS